MSGALKPCPFCGGPGTMRKRREVYGTFCCAECLECGAIARGVYSMDDERAESSAAKIWNRRAERTCRWKNVEGTLFVSDCGGSFDRVVSDAYCPNCGAKVVGEL